jgi:molybdate transport system permease protein
VNIAGVRFDMANEHARLREGAPCRIEIHAAGVSVWATIRKSRQSRESRDSR